MNMILSNGKWTLELSENGRMVGLTDASQSLSALSDRICELRGDDPERLIPVTSARLVHTTASSAEFETTLDAPVPLILRFKYRIEEPDDRGTALTCRVNLVSDKPLPTDILLRWPWHVRPRAHSSQELFVPLFDGRGLHSTLTREKSWHFVCSSHWGNESQERLALPAVLEKTERICLTHFADPFFSTGITLPAGESPLWFTCRFLKEAGARQFEERTFGSYLHTGDEDSSILGFFRYALPASPPGPRWLHDIAMVHYDYLSEKGEGWFRDIDRLGTLIPPEERGTIALTLHGWYDLLGRYSYDTTSRKIASRWIAMPKGDNLAMSPAEIHRRIAYA